MVAVAATVAAAVVTNVGPATGTARSAAPPDASALSPTATNAAPPTRTIPEEEAASEVVATAALVTGTARAAERWSSGLRATATSATRPAHNNEHQTVFKHGVLSMGF